MKLTSQKIKPIQQTTKKKKKKNKFGKSSKVELELDDDDEYEESEVIKPGSACFLLHKCSLLCVALFSLFHLSATFPLRN